MTPIEIIEEWREGKNLEHIGEPVTGVQIRIFTGERLLTSYCDYLAATENIREVSIKRETFGFFKAINLMREAKIICRRCRPTHEYRLINSAIRPFGEVLEERSVDSPYGWVQLSGYPLDWPDEQDFYEVK